MYITGRREKMQGMISDPSMAIRFILGGNAIVTFVSGKTGARYTYKVREAPKAGDRPPVHFVVLLTGPSNEDDYSYIGIITPDERFLWTKKSKVGPESPSVTAMKWVMDHLSQGNMPPMTEIWHEGRCGRCGRLLTVPESVDNGFGPECMGKALAGC